MWDEEGSASRIGLRWQAGTDTPPDYILGHIGLPWCHGNPTAATPRCALGLILAEAREWGWGRLELTTDGARSPRSV
jgi:hypothetical protein